MVDLYLGDCIEVMKTLPEASVDLFLVDPPYGTTACKWDNLIPFDDMWREIKRLRKPQTPIVFFSAQPFTSQLINSNLKEYKYQWVWSKNLATNFLHAKRQPLRKHEDIVVFYSKPGSYYPIKSEGHIPTQSLVKDDYGMEKTNGITQVEIRLDILPPYLNSK